MFVFEGYVIAFLIALFLLRDTISGYLPEASCLPKAKPSCPSVKLNSCGCNHYYKDFPVKAPLELPGIEHFAALDHIRTVGHTGEPNADQQYPTVKTGIYTPLYKGYFPWSYAYGGQPYGMYRPWWSSYDCNFFGCY